MKKIFELLVVSVTIWVMTIILIPGIGLYPTKNTPDENDSLHLTYVLNQIQINFENLDRGLFWGSYYFPYQKTLTFSNPLVMSSLMSWPIKLISNSPVLVYNWILFLGFWAYGLTTFWLVKRITKRFWLAYWGALIFVFGGFHLRHLPHINVFSSWLLPLLLLWWWCFLETGQKKYWWFVLVGMTLQLIDDVTIIFLFAAAAIWLWILKSERWRVLKRINWLVVLVFIGGWFWWLKPFLAVRQFFPETVRSINDVAHFSLGVNEFWWVVLVVLVILIKKVRKEDKKWGGMALLAIMLTCGPVVKWASDTVKILGWPIPLPYSLFYYLIPGFSVLRTPSRWLILAGLAGVVWLMLRLKKMEMNMSRLNKIFITLIVGGILLIAARAPRKTFEINLISPEVYSEVKNLPQEAVILELPIKLWNAPGNEIESIRAIYSLDHQKRRVNGYTSFSPDQWVNLINRLNFGGMNDELREELRQMGVTHLVKQNELKKL